MSVEEVGSLVSKLLDTGKRSKEWIAANQVLSEYELPDTVDNTPQQDFPQTPPTK